MIAWWKRAHRRGGCGAAAGCGPSGERIEGVHAGGDHGEYGAPFGVRRPLRFLAERLDLTDKQVAELARLMNDLKTERAQAAVDDRRTTAAFADALAGATFDEAKVAEATAARVRSAERLRDAVVKTLAGTYALLEPEQRERLAYLIRTGAITI
jgi:Spy/CpxP family protein refolding chaperone